MNERLRAFNLSIALHGTFVLAALALSYGLPARGRTAPLDLSLLSGAAPQEPERPLHPRARYDPAAAPRPAPEDRARPQVQRENLSPEMAPAAAPAAAAQAAEPQEAPGLTRDAVRARYTSDNFRSIRGRIQDNLVYPQMARKMGWTGRVVVSFVVGTDGCVKNVRVRSSCGHELLDRSAVETIKQGSPYPPPPLETELEMPIAYELE